jgi:hypothetical protein
MLIHGYVAAVTPETVNLPHDAALKTMLLCVLDHPQELRPARCAFAGDMPVGVYFYDLYAVSFCEGPAVSNLAINGPVCLVRPGGVSRIYNTFDHLVPPFHY